MFTPKILSITAAEANFTGIFAYACTIPGTILCFLVLVAYAITAIIPTSRPHLDRVTFRLLTYAMVFNVLYGIAFSVTAAQIAPGPLCTFGAFAVNFTLFFSTFFTTCIAINLQLVLVHNVNGKMMEKYYVIGTTILSLALTVPAYGLGQFGWQADSSTCWFRNPNHDLRLHWLIGSQSFWILFMATIETICSTVVLWYMVGYDIKLKALRVATHSTYSTKGSSSTRAKQEKASKYRNVIIRIALYPIVSLMINYSTSILDIYSTVHGVHTQLDFRLLVLDLCLYGVRTAAYGMLAMGDPSFLRALRAIRESRSKSQHSATLGPSYPNFASTDSTSRMTTSGQLTVNIELDHVTQMENSPGDKHGFEISQYHPSHEQGNKSATDLGRNGVRVLTSTGVVTTPGDAIRRAELKLDLEDDFRRQL